MHKVLSAWLSFAAGCNSGGNDGQITTAGAHGISELRSLLARLEAAEAQLSDIGARHDADAYAQLRRFYFSPDEPLTAISLRAEQYRQRLQRAVDSCGPDSAQVSALVEEVAAALSSRTVAAFLELDQRDRQGGGASSACAPGAAGSHQASSASSDSLAGARGAIIAQLARDAACDYRALQELRHELDLVGRSVEAAGVPLGHLLSLADGSGG